MIDSIGVLSKSSI